MGTKKEQKTIVTTEMILAKKGLVEKKPEAFYSEFFGGEIEVENSHAESFTEILSAGADDELYASSRLIYENCPLFRDKKLLEEYEIDDPYLIPRKVYGSNIIEFSLLAKHIMSVYGYTDSIVNDIKKK